MFKDLLRVMYIECKEENVHIELIKSLGRILLLYVMT